MMNLLRVLILDWLDVVFLLGLGAVIGYGIRLIIDSTYGDTRSMYQRVAGEYPFTYWEVKYIAEIWKKQRGKYSGFSKEPSESDLCQLCAHAQSKKQTLEEALKDLFSRVKILGRSFND